MEKESYDIVIPILKDDLKTLNKGIQFIKKYLDIKNIVLIGSKDIKEEICGMEGLVFIDEDKLYKGLTLKRIKYLKKQISGNERRSGWYYQQFLKMAYSLVCDKKYYIVWDSDTIPVKHMKFFDENGKPYLAMRQHEKFDESYFRTMKNILPNGMLKKKNNESFITEHMIINTEVMQKLINDIELNSNSVGKNFYEKIMNSIEIKDINLSGFSEFETYACYALNLYPDMYTLRYWRNLRNAKVFLGDNPTSEVLEWIGKDFVTISIEKFNRFCFIFNILKNKSIRKGIRFKYVYMFFNPMLNAIYNIKMILRSIIKR